MSDLVTTSSELIPASLRARRLLWGPLAITSALLSAIWALAGCTSPGEALFGVPPEIHQGVRWLIPADDDHFLGFNNFGDTDRLWYFDSSGHELWKTDLDGYSVETMKIATSPGTSRAAVYAGDWGVESDDTGRYRLLLLDLGDESPKTTVLREVEFDGFPDAEVFLAADGKSVGLYFGEDNMALSPDDPSRWKQGFEVVDENGTSVWRSDLPASHLGPTRVYADKKLDTAVMVVYNGEAGPEADSYAVVCRAPGTVTTLDAQAVGLDGRYGIQDVKVSPDGQLIAIRWSPGLSSQPGEEDRLVLCALYPEVKVLWQKSGPCGVPCFSDDGRMLVVSGDRWSSWIQNELTAEVTRATQVLSTADGNVLWQHEFRESGVSKDRELSDSGGATMTQFDSWFLLFGLSTTDTCKLVDLTGSAPMAKDISLPELYGLVVAHDGSVVMGVDRTNGTAVPVPVP